MSETVTIDQLQTDLENAIRFRERRHQQWTDNNLLYRDKVIVNRLTQRQSVNVPMMKEIIRTSLSRTGDFPDLYFEELTNDGQKELYINEYWNHVSAKNFILLIDEIDRKQEALYGRSYVSVNIVDGEIVFEVKDPFDILVDRHANPWDIDSADFVVDTGIIVPLSRIARNKMYDKDAVARLKSFYASRQGLVKANDNAMLYEAKQQRQADLGVTDASSPLLSETYVQINLFQKKVWEDEKAVMKVIPVAENEILMQRPMKELLGINRCNLRSWADDLERTDWYSDGMADIVRQPNHILNAWLSQLTENRTLRNFGMNFYDSTKNPDWRPTGYVPEPWGFYPLPGNPNDVLKRVEVSELSESLDEMRYVKEMTQAATAATAIETGQGDGTGKTLGEIQILTAQATKRLTYISKFHKQFWKELGELFVEIVNANASELNSVTLYKKGASGKYYEKELNPSELASSKGYKCRVTSKTEREADSLKSIQKIQLVSNAFPTNQPLNEIKKEKMLSLLDLTPDEKKSVMDFEDQTAMPGAPGLNPAMLNPAMSPPTAPQPMNAL